MVKLYSLSVLYKNDMSVKWLKTAHDLSSFNFFQRGCVQEFMTFVGKTLVERTQLATRQSIKEGEYMCHVYVNVDGLAGIVISDHEYPTRVAHTLLTKVLSDFASNVPQNLWKTANEDSISFNQLPVYLSKYQVPKEVDAMTKIQEELDETKIILHNTCEAVLRRGENLDNLVSKSEELSLQAKGFYKTARKTNSCCSYM
ncbi:snare protein ykt6, putative [Pediculus humanus corporis]|uniref:Snare protein ykt6, putative n=1 Tax=Pediculus humanus subsp. corporis TaxID=121224 RepID=E0VRC4_PEDHC|nr:snare protein ykt6, putative [Pediculus humanus corporis]EEB15930.1 snare protein ykt6, putative [Pediculus humanus corporis]